MLGRKDARALVQRLGGETADDVNARTTMLVVGSEGFGPAPQTSDETRDKSNKLKRAEELNAQQRTLKSRSSPRTILPDWRASRRRPALKQQYHAMRDLLARYRALREDHLRYLVKCGVLRPVLRTNAETFFAFPDLAIIKQANDGSPRAARSAASCGR